ncbi:hypothetical protein [Nocardioides sp.]|uniref:hypothetical protein n=1 Tax=Nocardioides sp. TaxID=35761 RepID=UPI0032192BB0
MSSWRLSRSVAKLVGELRGQRPGIVLHTYREPIDPGSDHTAWLQDNRGVGVVRAVDIMTRDGDKLAANLAAKLGKHPAMTAGAYVIWKQRIISADRLGEGWRPMPDRGSDTQNHFDHVHVSVARAQGAYDFAGKWGALFVGTGTGAAPVPSGAPTTLDTTPTGTASGTPYAAALTPVVPIGLGVPGVDDIGAGIERGLLFGGALLLGAVLVALGAARVTRPVRDEVTETGKDIGGKLAAVAPQTRAVSAAGAATKGTR